MRDVLDRALLPKEGDGTSLALQGKGRPKHVERGFAALGGIFAVLRLFPCVHCVET